MQINGFYTTYTDDSGSQHTIFAGTEFALWSQLNANSDKQNNAAGINSNAVVAYMNDIHAYNLAPEKLTVPVKPTKLVVSDMGTETRVPFDPPLPDPVTYNPAGSAGSGKSTTNLPAQPLTDGEKALMAGITYLTTQVANLAALVAKLTPKV